MKNKLMQKLFRFLGQWILPRFAQRLNGKPKFVKANKDKKNIIRAEETSAESYRVLKKSFPADGVNYTSN